jgi:hypothetical protein
MYMHDNVIPWHDNCRHRKGSMTVPSVERSALVKTIRARATDPETGQILDLEWKEPLKRRPGRHPRAIEPFAIVFPESLPRLARMRLTGTERQVLDCLIATMGFEGPFTASPTTIGDMLDLDRRNVASAMTRLRRLGVIIAMPNREILLDPLIVWRGSLRSRVEWLARLEKPREEES